MKTRHMNIMIQNMLCCFGCMCMHISMEILCAPSYPDSEREK